MALKRYILVPVLLLLMLFCTGAKFGGGWILKRSVGFGENMSTLGGNSRGSVLLSANYYTSVDSIPTTDSIYTIGAMWNDGTALNFSQDSTNSDTTGLYLDAFFGEFANMSVFFAGATSGSIRVEVEQGLSYNTMIRDSLGSVGFGFYKTDTLFESSGKSFTIIAAVSDSADYSRQLNDNFQIIAPCVRLCITNVGARNPSRGMYFDLYARRSNYIMGGSSGRK